MQGALLPFLQKKCGHTPKYPLLAPIEQMAHIALAAIFFLLQKHTEIQNTGTATSLQMLASFSCFTQRLHKGYHSSYDLKSSF